jgi:hypothetical protein
VYPQVELGTVQGDAGVGDMTGLDSGSAAAAAVAAAAACGSDYEYVHGYRYLQQGQVEAGNLSKLTPWMADSTAAAAAAGSGGDLTGRAQQERIAWSAATEGAGFDRASHLGSGAEQADATAALLERCRRLLANKPTATTVPQQQQQQGGACMQAAVPARISVTNVQQQQQQQEQQQCADSGGTSATWRQQLVRGVGPMRARPGSRSCCLLHILLYAWSDVPQGQVVHLVLMPWATLPCSLHWCCMRVCA